MDKPVNITQIIEQQRLGYFVPKQVDIAYNKLKCTVNDVDFFDGFVGESFCPVFACKFCHVKKYEHLVAAANEDGKISISNTKSSKNDKVLSSFQAHDNAIFDIAWTNYDTQLITASGDHSSTLWQVSEGTVQSLLQFHGHQHSVKIITCRPDDRYTFATGARDGALLVWDTRVPDLVTEVKPDVSINFAHEAQRFLKHRKVGSQTNSITGLVYQDDNTLISCSAGNGLIKIWDMRKTYSYSKRLPQAKFVIPYSGTSGRNGYSSLSISPCRLRLYGNCIDNKLYCYNIGTYSEKPISIYSGHRVSSFYIKNCVSPDGRYVASGSNDGKAYIWSVSNPSVPLVSLSGHNAEVTGVDWCKEGEPKIVTCSDDATYRIWRVYPQEFDCHDPTLRGWAERYRIREICPSRNSLKRKFYCSRHIDLVPRHDVEMRRFVNDEVKQVEKKPCLNNSLDLSSLTADLPNYVVDGVSPHVHHCRSSPKVKDANWLEKLKQKAADTSKKSQESSSPARRKSSQKNSAKGSILRFFKVSTRQPTCEQASNSTPETKSITKSVNLPS
ncbi:unnamed protein product [Nezara viridula]|uniref:Uncharacterized protein n=1 Tax=Nezara viridula TaxID=85310 RepID=A0A9P0HLV9_NEZVI|nr:unnamed protein product [Nezara viridula]